jgi:type I restriction enzyme R subunit
MCLKSLFQESTLEQATIDWFTEVGWNTLHGSVIAPQEPQAERQSYQDVILSQRLYDAIALLNPGIPDDALKDAFRKISHPDSPSLIASNRTFHRWLTDGVEVEYRRPDGSVAGDRVCFPPLSRQKN